MNTLGYVVSENKIKNLKGFVDNVNDISLVDSAKPVLLVGIDLAKKNIDKFNILEKKVNDKLFWTFKKTERRVDFETDVDYFYEYIINSIIHDIDYYYINILKLKYSKIKKLYNIIYSNDKKYIYISNDMIYLLYNKKSILGISLKIIEYLKIDKNKILKKLYSNKNNIICTDVSTCVKDIKSEIGNKKYVIPYFMSLNN